MRSHTIIRQNSSLDTNLTWIVICCVRRLLLLDNLTYNSSMLVVDGYCLTMRWLYSILSVGNQESLQILISDMLEEIISVYFRKSYITFMLLFDECSTCYCPFSIKMHLLYCCQKKPRYQTCNRAEKKMGKNNRYHKERGIRIVDPRRIDYTYTDDPWYV